MALLGDDGHGYDLAWKLESCDVWRSWLGESLYANFVPYLSAPSVWETFMRSDDSKSRAQIHLQLRARALLFDKSCLSLFLQSSLPPSSSIVSPPSVSKLNPTYLQLHGDDVYFTLESCSQDGVRQRDGVPSANSSSSKIQSKTAFSVGSRYGASEMDNLSQRFRHEDFPETWYNQFIEKYKATKPYSLSFGDRELDRRTPEEMSAYLRLCENHKRRRLAFEEDQYMGVGNPIMENKSNLLSTSFMDGHNTNDRETPFFPETMFTLNCIPDTALLPRIGMEENPKVKFYGVLDTLPQVMTRSTVMIERLGLRPEYLNTVQGGSQYRGRNGLDGNRIFLGQEQASQLSEKVIARMLPSVGFEGGKEVPMEVFSQLLSCHIGKLGRILKVLADSYRKQCSATELVKMFLQSAGYSNFGALVELVKDGTRNSVKQTQQVQGMQPQLQPQLQSPLRQSQQIPRQMHPQMQQMVHPQNLAFQQQQWDTMRRRQLASPRPGMDMDKDRPLVQVKVENPPDLPIDSNTFNTMNARQTQMQFRQQQMAAMSNLHAQSSNQFRQMASLQVPQAQTQNMAVVRAPPVKVEGFQELMGGDTTLKHDSEGNKLTSPSK